MRSSTDLRLVAGRRRVAIGAAVAYGSAVATIRHDLSIVGAVLLAGALAAIGWGVARIVRVGEGEARRWIYGGLALGFALVQALILWKVIPNRLPSAALQLWSFPVLTAAMGFGTLAGGRAGRWAAVIAGSALLASVALVIVRILISAAFLAGVYGAFGKAASTFALVAVALVVEVVALLPIFHLKFLMTRAGRRALGDPAPA